MSYVPIPNPLPVTGPLTDTQLRATAVPVSGPLTDTQLRATAVPVSISSPTDTYTGFVKIIEASHAMIHAGVSFTYYDSVTLDNTVSQDYLLTTAAGKYTHLIIHGDGSAITSFYFYESSDKTGTTSQTVFNNNRNSGTAATTTIKKGTSGGTTDGTQISIYIGGSSTNQSKGATDASFGNEWILKPDTKYLFRVTSGTNTNLCNINFHWYEL